MRIDMSLMDNSWSRMQTVMKIIIDKTQKQHIWTWIYRTAKSMAEQGTKSWRTEITNFVSSIWLEKTEWKKIWQARIQDSSSLKTPVHSRLPYTFGVFWKYGFLKMFFFQKKFKIFALNHCWCMLCGVLLLPTTMSGLNTNLLKHVLWHLLL